MKFYTIHPNEIEEVKRKRDAVVVDIRPREEYREYHYPQAVCCPYETKDSWVWNFTAGKRYILYCEHGGGSMLAARQLGRMGVEAYSVIGGMDAIKKEMLRG